MKPAGVRDKKSDITCYHYLSECPHLDHKKSSDKKLTDVKQPKNVGQVEQLLFKVVSTSVLSQLLRVDRPELRRWERLSRAKVARDRASQEVRELELLQLQDRLDCPQSPEGSNTVSHNGVLHSVSTTSNPLPYTRICVEGCLVSAMLDTGSSVSIMGEELFVQIARGIDLDKATVKPPQVLLRNFGDGEIYATACVPLRFAAEGKEVTESVYIVPNSQPECLLGVTTVTKLSLIKFADSVKLRREGPTAGANSEGADTVHAVHAVHAVRLITQTTVPGSCGVTIIGRAGGLTGNPESLLFESNIAWMESKGLLTKESVVTFNENGDITVVLKNGNTLRVAVEGDTIGTVSPCDIDQDVTELAQTTVREEITSTNTTNLLGDKDIPSSKRETLYYVELL